MGQLVYIYSKTNKASEILNTKLKALGIKNAFNTEQDNIEWLKDINTNKESYHKHLKPAGRDLQMAELQEMFKGQTEPNVMSFDVAFDRCDDEEGKKYLNFIEDNIRNIKHLRGADELITRYDVSNSQKILIKKFNIKDNDPEKLPIAEQYIPKLESGLLLCKSWGLEPFWVIFGNVDSPTFLKSKIYKDDLYNEIYKDKKGYAYLLIPLIRMDITNTQLDELIESIWNMGVREDPYYYMPIIYGIDIPNDAYKSYPNTYTIEEIEERFLQQANQHKYNNRYGIGWNSTKSRFVVYGGENTIKNIAAMSVLTNLLMAILIKKGDVYVADLMTKSFNTHYIPSEFKLK
jgi:hypothetical protein